MLIAKKNNIPRVPSRRKLQFSQPDPSGSYEWLDFGFLNLYCTRQDFCLNDCKTSYFVTI